MSLRLQAHAPEVLYHTPAWVQPGVGGIVERKASRVSVKNGSTWGIDYPRIDRPLYANVREVSGWCFHGEEPVESIELLIDEKRESTAILGYPRLETASLDPSDDRFLRSGFRCEFDFEGLSIGPHVFELRARAPSGQSILRIQIEKVGERNPILVNDVFIDIVGLCNLRCAMCPHGDLEGMKTERPTGFMSPDLFERIVDHLLASGFMPESVNLYNWGEPLLHPDLDGILESCGRRDLRVVLSSNLSVPEWRLKPLLRHPIELLMVSVSGFTEEAYRRNHRGGDFDRVRRNLEILGRSEHHIGTVLLKFLVFDHNEHEIEVARRFAEDRDLGFGAYKGAIPSVESFSSLRSDASYAKQSRELVDPSRVAGIPTRSCPQETKIVINHEGRLEHCSMSWNRIHERSVLELDLRDHLLHKLDNDACRSCLESGYSHYRHFEVIDPALLRFCDRADDVLEGSVK